MYEGEFVKGMIECNGIEYYPNGEKKYEGEWKNNLPHGKGKRFYENGKLYCEGNYFEGKLQGYSLKLFLFILF